MQGCNPSADPGTKTEAGCPARHPVSLGPREPRDWYQSDKSRGPGGRPPEIPFLHNARIVRVPPDPPKDIGYCKRFCPGVVPTTDWPCFHPHSW